MQTVNGKATDYLVYENPPGHDENDEWPKGKKLRLASNFTIIIHNPINHGSKIKCNS